MRKFLVVLLILSVMGGAFAQELTISGEASATSTIDLTDDPIGFAGGAEAKVIVSFGTGPWAFKFPLKVTIGGVEFDGDANVEYGTEGEGLYGKLAFSDWETFGITIQYGAKNEGNGFKFALDGVSAGDNFGGSTLGSLFGWYTFGDGLLGVNYKGAEFGWFKIFDLNIVQGFFWDDFEGIGFKYGIGDLSFGIMLDSLFGVKSTHVTEEFGDAFTSLSLGAKFANDDIKIAGIFGLNPGIDIFAYAGTEFGVLDLINVGFDLSVAIKNAANDPEMNFGLQAGYGPLNGETFDPVATLTLKGTNLIADARSMGLNFYAAYNRHSNTADNGGDYGEGSGPWAFLTLDVPNFMASQFAMNFEVWGGINGDLNENLSYYAVLGFAGGLANDFTGALGFYAGASFGTDVIAEKLAFSVGLDLGLELTNTFKNFGFGFKVSPELAWSVWEKGTITFGYNIGAGIGSFAKIGDTYGEFFEGYTSTSFGVIDNAITIKFGWTF